MRRNCPPASRTASSLSSMIRRGALDRFYDVLDESIKIYRQDLFELLLRNFAVHIRTSYSVIHLKIKSNTPQNSAPVYFHKHKVKPPQLSIENRTSTLLSAGDSSPALIELFHQLNDLADHRRIAFDIGFGKMPDHE